MMIEDLLVTAIVGTALAAILGGVVLTFYTDDPTWLIMSAVAFIFFYAG